jgi:ATPase subunit of ABC transporter with duplicated ATPase domains
MQGEADARRNAERLARAVDAYEAMGVAGKDQRIERVLNGLGFAREDHNRSCTEFSGGWQMRIALARLLLSEPELLLLDEPTNHLDLQERKKKEKKTKKSPLHCLFTRSACVSCVVKQAHLDLQAQLLRGVARAPNIY